MSGDDGSDNQGLQINTTTILALLTLVGGILLVTNRLSSDRPVVFSRDPNPEISEQKMDTRLWEDPFGAVGANTKGLEQYIGYPGNDPRASNKFNLLVVMIPAGPASEDRELRIRSRFAVVSGLAESAYAPVLPSQIGIGQMPWPTTANLWKKLGKGERGDYCTFKTWVSNYFPAHSSPDSMYYTFEWYEREFFLKHRNDRSTNVAPLLVVWVDEDQFNDYPIPRLDWFLRKLGKFAPHTTNELFAEVGESKTNEHRIMLIGPGRSDTLKAMFHGDYGGGLDNSNRTLGIDFSDLTKTVSVFLASPRAIDEVLVKANSYDDTKSRSALISRLTNVFGSATNFAPTDADLASAILDELDRRGANLADTKNHLVLIGGWDDYFGRMLSIAYATELAAIQPGVINRDSFFKEYCTNSKIGPTNIHNFLYLSGLDGQGLSKEIRSGENGSSSDSEMTNGFSEAGSDHRWTPDVNRAEGPAQFDYLGRLAKRIQDLNDDLQNKGEGTVTAIGIGGGDVYDTLLILQALRPRFPDAIFFTTQLDARFWDPKEWPWSRNLVVVNGYDISLPSFTQTAPFRDSQQTAVFAATLAAMQNTNVPDWAERDQWPIQRFEIGRNGPVKLLTTKDSAPKLRDWITLRWASILGLIVCSMLLALALSTNVRLLSVRQYQFLAQPLWLREEDIGGLQGFIEIARQVKSPPTGLSPVAKQWLKKTIKLALVHGQRDLDRILSEQGAESIFTPADIQNLDQFLWALKENARIADTPPKAILAKFLHGKLPASAQMALDKWDGTKAFKPLTEITEALRDIINSEDLMNIPHNRPGVRCVNWRRNRNILAATFPDLLRRPRSMHDLVAKKPITDGPLLLQDPDYRDHLQSVMFKVIMALNASWPKPHPSRLPTIPTGASRSLSQRIAPVTSKNDLRCLKDFREEVDKSIALLVPARSTDKCTDKFDFRKAAEAARKASEELFWLRGFRRMGYLALCVGAFFLSYVMFLYNVHDVETWSWTISGATLWPTNWIYVFSLGLGFLFIIESYFRLRTTVLETTRHCRLAYCHDNQVGVAVVASQWTVSGRFMAWVRRMLLPSGHEPVLVVDANDSWVTYIEGGRRKHRVVRAFALTVPYFLLIISVNALVSGHVWDPHLRQPAATWYKFLAWSSFSVFLFLSFWTIDAAFLCRWFIKRISQGPTFYSEATRRYFSEQRGQVPYHVLSEWIDVSIIAQITERVGMLIYFPSIMISLIIFANSNLFYYFPWPPLYYVLAGCDVVLAAGSIVVLQRAAIKARDQSMDSLQQKLNQLKASSAITQPEVKQHDISETEALLNDIRYLRKGAFRGFWTNPVVGALLIPSSGTALVQILKLVMR